MTKTSSTLAGVIEQAAFRATRRSIQMVGTAQASFAQASARASFAKSGELLSAPGSADAPEYNLQWMPPGPHDITCFVNGTPCDLKFTVTAKHAELLNQQLQAMLAKANAGAGDKPLTDYNHEDGAASSRPLRMVWGGNDPKTGGIRLIGKWTANAKEAIRDEEYDRFSPQWNFDKTTGDPVSIGINIGGLVNKAAFQSISKVQAKDASGALENPHTEPPGGWYDLVLNRSKEKGISIQAAAHEITAELPYYAAKFANLSAARKNPGTQDRFYPYQIQADAAYAMRGSKPMLPLENHPFIAQARAMSAATGVTEPEAQVLLARANFPLYQQYFASLKQASRKHATAQASESGQSGFLREINTAMARGLSFDAAVNAVAVSRPDLAESYRRSFMPSVRSAH